MDYNEVVICPKTKECPFSGCQHHKPHPRIWRHQVDCTNPSRSMAEGCQACMKAKESHSDN